MKEENCLFFLKPDCSGLPGPLEGCRRVFLGKRQTEDLTLGLYRAAAADKAVDQVKTSFKIICAIFKTLLLLWKVKNGIWMYSKKSDFYIKLLKFLNSLTK